MIKKNVLKIGSQMIKKIEEILVQNTICGKFLFVSDNLVYELYGSEVERQVLHLGIVKTLLIDDNTIEYAMSIAERVIATDINYIIGLGGGKVLDVCKYYNDLVKLDRKILDFKIDGG